MSNFEEIKKIYKICMECKDKYERTCEPENESKEKEEIDHKINNITTTNE